MSGETVATIKQIQVEAKAEAAARVQAGADASGSRNKRASLKDLKAARKKAAAAIISANQSAVIEQNFLDRASSMLASVDDETIEKTADMEILERLESAHATAVNVEKSQSQRQAITTDSMQLRRVIEEIEREVELRGKKRQEGSSHVEILSVTLENNCVLEAEEIQRRLSIRGKMVDELQGEMRSMNEALQRVHGSRIAEMEAHSSRFVDYVALEDRLNTADKTLERLGRDGPALEELMPSIARGIEEFEDRRRETDRLVKTCWETCQDALDKYAQELGAELDAALAPATANIEALRVELARSKHDLEVLNRPEQRPQTAGTGRSLRRSGGRISRPRGGIVGASYDGGREAAGQSAGQPSRNSRTSLTQRRPASANVVSSARRGHSWDPAQGDADQHRRRRGTDPEEPLRLLSGQQQTTATPDSVSSFDMVGGREKGPEADTSVVARPGSAGSRLLRHSPRQTLPVASR